MSRSTKGMPWVRAANGILLAALAGYGAFLRWYAADVSLYDTEILARERADESLGYILMHGGAPLHDLLMKASLRLGDTEAALRLPGLLAGVLTILAAWALLCRLHSRTAGLVAAALVTFNPFLINLSQYASPEALLLLFALLSAWALIEFLETRRWYAWLAFTACAILALAPNSAFLPALILMTAASALYLLAGVSGGPAKRITLAALLVAGAAAAPALLGARGHDPRESWRFDVAVWAPSQANALQVAPERPMGGGQAETTISDGKTRYRLTAFDLVEYLKRTFWNTSRWIWAAIVPILVWGLLDLLYRRPAAGIVFASGSLLGPAALFLFTQPHPYHPRDFAFLAIFAIVLAAAGVCVLPRFLAHLTGAPRNIRLWRRTEDSAPHPPMSAPGLIYPAIIIALAAPLAPQINAAYQSYPVYGYLPLGPGPVNRVPVHNWKALFEEAAPVAGVDDVFVFMGPDYGYGPRFARYYLERLRRWRPANTGPDLRFGKPDAALLRALAAEHPNVSLWFAGTLSQQVRDFENFFTAAGARHRDFLENNTVDGLRLYALGAPVTNLAINSDFEAGWSQDELPPGVALDRRGAGDGAQSIRIGVAPAEDGSTPGEAFARVRVAPQGYRLRNNGFEAWRDGMPVGWIANEGADAAIEREDQGFQGGVGLRLKPAESPTMLRQSIPVPLAPGRTLQVQAMGHCETPNNLHLTVRFNGPGFQEERHAVHPGNGQWILMQAEMDIPENADPNSIALEVWRTPGGTGNAIVDNVELRVKNLGSRLEPGAPYTVSMLARTANLQARGGARGHGAVRLAWVTPDGETGHAPLMPLRPSVAWRPVHGVFHPGKDIPLEIEELYVEIGIEAGNTGLVWADNVQVEAGDRPTPYARTYRLPHDEALANIDLGAFNIETPW
ncbi:MAG: glycosyltransferase family 39 protein [Candidatus Hydrogenedentes bacterium]|nr:glycosyltransferase family 39 protein [Candidatus Hydrogenedentota bacterium]